MLEPLIFRSDDSGWSGYSGPGPQTLAFGTPEAGYFGEVTQAELMTPAEMLAQVPGWSRSQYNADSTWLKFAFENKVLFISKKPIVNGATWYQLYDFGLVYGVDGNGTTPPTVPKNQLTVVKKNTHSFKARLIRNDTADPSYLAVNANDVEFRTSEYTSLLYRVSNTVYANYSSKWANFTPTELGISSGYELVRETRAAAPTESFMRTLLGNISRTKDNNTFMSRMVLELLIDEIFALRSVYTSLTSPIQKPIGNISVSVNEASSSIVPLLSVYQKVSTAPAPSISPVRATVADTSAVLPITAKSIPSMGIPNSNLVFSVK